MLTILDINPTGYFSFGVHKTIGLHELGVTLLEGLNNDRNGSANGAGKTSLFNTLCQILFDKNPTEYTGNEIVNEILGKSFGKVTFLDTAGDKWRVICTRKWRKTDKYPCDDVENEASQWHNESERYSGTDVYLEKWNGKLWTDERSTNTQAGDTRLDLKATRKKILQVVGMSYQQFMNVAYLAQQQSLKFVNGTHKEKLEVISELSDIGVWDKRLAKVKEKIKQVDSEIDRSKSILDGANRAGAMFNAPSPVERVAISDAIKSAQVSIAQCDLDIQRASDKRASWVSDCASIDAKISDARKNARELLAKKQSINTLLNDLSNKYGTDCALIRGKQPPSTIVDMKNDVSSLKGQITTRRWDLEQLLTGSGKCPRCRTNVTDDHLLRQRELLSIEIKETEDKVKILNEKISAQTTEWEIKVAAELALAEQQYIKDRGEHEQNISFIDSAVEMFDRQEATLLGDKANLGKDPHADITQATSSRMYYMGILSRQQEALADLDRRQVKWDEYRKVIDDAKNDVVRLENDMIYLRAIEKAFGDKGIKAHKLGTVLHMLNKTVQEFADILTDGSVKVWITPFREKADGSMSTDMQIVVREGDKRETPFGLYSGGEKQQIVLAFIGAFWHVATAQGSGVNILCLDEIFGPLDELNAVGVFNYLDHMKSQGKSTIMVVTHDKNIKNQLNFDRKWLVEKTNHVSQLITDVQ